MGSRARLTHHSLITDAPCYVFVQSIDTILIDFRLNLIDDIRELNGHTNQDDEIKRQRLHYGSDQLYSVSLIFFPALNFTQFELCFFKELFISFVIADVADQVGLKFERRQTPAGYWQRDRSG